MKGGLYKMAVILSVSITKEQQDFISEMKISPSEMLQRSINDEMARSRVTGAQLKEANDKIKRLVTTVSAQSRFISENKLLEKYNEVAEELRHKQELEIYPDD